MANGKDDTAQGPDNGGANTAPRAGETREERLARQLRENLRRRKAQARAMRDPADKG